MKILYTRKTDVTMSLVQRSNLERQMKPDIFVSIHVNDHTNKSARGIETFHFPTSSKGRLLARDVHSSLINSKLYTVDRGVKTANFHVLRETRSPSCLVELGFINNVDDVKILTNNLDGFARAIANGIKKHVSNNSVVMLDPGHGGTDSGAVNRSKNLLEKDINLYVALKVGEILEGKDNVTQGWEFDSGVWTYVTDKGGLYRGWLLHKDKWYYLDPRNGQMVTGFHKINGKWYGFNQSGAMLSDTALDITDSGEILI